MIEKDDAVSAARRQSRESNSGTVNVQEPDSSTLNDKEHEQSDVDADVKETVPAEEEYVYLTGIKLGLVMVGVTLVAFLMLLDMSIVVTASYPRPNSTRRKLQTGSQLT
jgi:hypothetical protein